MEEDVHFMKMALREARKGIGRTSPNPAVGAIVVHDGRVVGKGCHRVAGGPHAEVHALRDAAGQAKGATIYVTLEPCNHYGRTPPCSKAIVESGISRVVVGMKDPNPLVAGAGNNYLISEGLEVKCGVLEKECISINRPFIKYIQKGTPWIVLKAGLSLDGKIALPGGRSTWITGDKSRRHVHTLRDRLDAIMVGITTVEKDNPSLTTRLSKGKGRDPLRVILDTNLKMSPEAKMLQQKSSAATLIYCAANCDKEKKERLAKKGAIVQPVAVGDDGHVDLKMVLSDLGRREISSVLVEGGSKVHASFIEQRLADQVNLFFAPFFIGGDGLSVVSPLNLATVQEASRLTEIKTRKFGDDLLIDAVFDSSSWAI